jgi:hypothetical protein
MKSPQEWPREAVAMARAWRAEGYSFGNISKMLHAAGYPYTRNACIGKGSREGWPQITPDDLVRVARKPRAPKPQRQPVHKPRSPKPPKPIEPPAPITARIYDASRLAHAVNIVDLPHNGCKFGVDEVNGQLLFCGAERQEGSPYCAHHTARAYVARPNKPQRMIIA